MATGALPGVEDRLRRRVCADYVDLPGLRLTPVQAARLWNVPVSRSRQVLDSLVTGAFLRREGDVYIRADAPSA